MATTDTQGGQGSSTGGGGKPKIRTLHLHQVSLQRSDTNAQIAKDIAYACATGADVIGFTEVVGQEHRALFKREIRENGYEPIVPTGTGLTVPLAVKLNGDPNTKVKSKGAKLALQGVAGQYENRYISWVQVRWYDQNLWVHDGHWSRTKWGANRHRDVSAMMAGQVKKHGKGDAISFWMGDLNIDELDDDRPTHLKAAENLSQIFRDNGLLSLFDEMHVNPPATLQGKGTYDIIGCYRPDKQVKGVRYKVWPRQNSDHAQVSGWYEVDVSRKASISPVGTTGTETETDPTEPEIERVDPDFYATGGNISWDDFLNDDLYPLPYAYGDSDSRTYG